MNKKNALIVAIVLVALILFIFIKNNYNFFKTGNNMSNKSADEIKNYILNMSSFKAEATVTVTSNKTTNTYKLLQKYKDKQFVQELLEPENISGLKIVYDGTNMKIENTKLSLSKLYDNYQYMTSNALCITTFISDFIDESNEKNIKEENNTIILEVKTKNENIYNTNKKLYIDKTTALPVKMEIKDNTQNLKVYILYNKVEINTLQKENIVAFKIDETQSVI